MSSKYEGSDMEIAAMSPTAQKFYRKSFLPRYKKLLESIKRTPLVILVWGPGKTNGVLYKKRLQILNILRGCGHAALFSEQIDADCPIKYVSAKARELLQAKGADFIVVIAASPGSIAEAHDFAGFIKDIGSKMLIFIDEEAQEGYSYTGALKELRTLYDSVKTYNYQRDIEECRLAEPVQEKVQVLQYIKWRENLK